MHITCVTYSILTHSVLLAGVWWEAEAAEREREGEGEGGGGGGGRKRYQQVR